MILPQPGVATPCTTELCKVVIGRIGTRVTMETAAQNQFEWLVQATLELFKSSKRGAVRESRTAKIKILVGSSGARDR